VQVTEPDTDVPKVEVAVLNGTAPEPGAVGVEDVAERAGDIVKEITDADYKIGAVETAGSFPTSVVMFEEGSKAEARALALSLEPTLGETAIDQMTEEIRALSKGAGLALVVGLDDQGI